MSFLRVLRFSYARKAWYYGFPIRLGDMLVSSPTPGLQHLYINKRNINNNIFTSTRIIIEKILADEYFLSFSEGGTNVVFIFGAPCGP